MYGWMYWRSWWWTSACILILCRPTVPLGVLHPHRRAAAEWTCAKHGAMAVPAQCPHSARTVPAQCPHSARCKKPQCPHFIIIRQYRSLHYLSLIIIKCGHCSFLQRALCGHCAGTERALSGHCKGTMFSTEMCEGNKLHAKDWARIALIQNGSMLTTMASSREWDVWHRQNTATATVDGQKSQSAATKEKK